MASRSFEKNNSEATTSSSDDPRGSYSILHYQLFWHQTWYISLRWTRTFFNQTYILSDDLPVAAPAPPVNQSSGDETLCLAVTLHKLVICGNMQTDFDWFESRGHPLDAFATHLSARPIQTMLPSSIPRINGETLDSFIRRLVKACTNYIFGHGTPIHDAESSHGSAPLDVASIDLWLFDNEDYLLGASFVETFLLANPALATAENGEIRKSLRELGRLLSESKQLCFRRTLVESGTPFTVLKRSQYFMSLDDYQTSHPDATIQPSVLQKLSYVFVHAINGLKIVM